ncbi:FecCD family ABC transporter permease [Ralstonia solanacearum]|uniref:FecCD family ABC transporter permease n=1 Tax=Ralstonia solanacearum TaxID=305 RepID=UPI00050676C8|nr:iron ABC transporter permease [Ralstonia solanacearum]KFX27388.1 hemin ABC transporter permease [Ralstonia solanacearum]
MSTASSPGRWTARTAVTPAEQGAAPLRLPPRWLLGGLAAGLAAVTVAALCIGAYAVEPSELWAAWIAPASDPAGLRIRAVLVDIRLPRVVLALLLGGALGASGAALQAIFRNPLADPGLIGVSSGAALGAATAIVGLPLLGGAALTHAVGPALLPLAAFGGALLVTVMVYRLAARRGCVSLPLLLLAGIAINALATALIGLMLYLATDAQQRTLTFWSLGSAGGAQWRTLAVVAPPALLGCAWLLRMRGALTALQLGDAAAAHLGVPVRRVQKQVLAAAALAVSALVSCTGVIGFIGLVAPHGVRLLCGPDQRTVMPGAMLLGALLTVGADLAARTLAAPADIPLGVLTALFGAPFFMLLLARRRGTL